MTQTGAEYEGQYPTEPATPVYPSSCTPGGVVITEHSPYWYIVQPEDLHSFWAIPQKFSLPTKAGDAWTWHQLRNANFDWQGGFAPNSQGICQLQGLFAGAKLHVPATWPSPLPGVAVEPKRGTDPREGNGASAVSAGTYTAAIVIGGIGLVGIGTLAWIAHRDRRRGRG